jgi:hypothetical protein
MKTAYINRNAFTIYLSWNNLLQHKTPASTCAVFALCATCPATSRCPWSIIESHVPLFGQIENPPQKP